MMRPRLSSTSRMRTHTRAFTSPSERTGTERQPVVGRIGQSAARIEAAARGAADESAGAELAHIVRLGEAGAYRAVPEARRSSS